MSAHDTRTFYDELADDYHLVYADWAAAVTRHGTALARLILDGLGPGTKSVLDCSCGIGTQALGLAGHGHRVIGTDLSPRAVARAAQEATARGDTLAVAAADMRCLPFTDDCFDVVLSADNSIAHLLTDGDLSAAFASMKRVLRPGGLLVVTMRDYAEALASRQHATPLQVVDTPDGRAVTFQLWRRRDGSDCYDFDHVQLLPDGDSWRLRTRSATSRALAADHVARLAREAGFVDVRWRDPASSGFFQPVLTAGS